MVPASPATDEPPRSPARRRRLDADELADLEEQRDVLLRSLDDLEREHAAGELDDDDYGELRDATTRRAAALVRAVETGRVELAARPGPSRARVLAGGALLAALAVAAGLAVASASGTRQAGEATSGEIREILDSRLAEASTLARQGDVQGALDLYDAVLVDDPDNVEALSERALLLASLSDAAGLPGLLVAGRESIDRALQVDPGNPRSLFYLGLIQRLEGDEAAAVATLEEALGSDPPPELRQDIERFLGPTSAPATESPAPQGDG